jgi:hypothetical protein
MATPQQAIIMAPVNRAERKTIDFSDPATRDSHARQVPIG